MTTRTRTLALTLAVALLLVTAACGDDGGDDGSSGSGRPTESEISIDLRNDSGFPPSTADCLAGILADSELSDGALRDFLEADLEAGGNLATDDMSKADQTALAAMAEELNVCLGGAAPSTGSTPATDGSSTTTPPADGSTTAPATDGSSTTAGGPNSTAAATTAPAG